MNLQKARKAKGVTQAALAERTGVNLRTIQDYEAGRRILDNAYVGTLITLADFLEVPFYDLLEDAELANRIKANVKREV